ncbi:ThiF family adenylyltransferase [Paracoccaceae bacterium GXU_MW_L88]
MSRHDRQIVLPEIGPVGQAKLAGASVLVIGAGGLGAPALLYLAAAGIGRIGIADSDVVSLSNLQRQILYKEADCDQPKAETARRRLLEIDANLTIETYPAITHHNTKEIFARYDVILDGTDNFATRFLANDAALKSGRPLVQGAVLGLTGQLGVFGHEDGPCYRCLHPEPPQMPVKNCAEAGVIGAVCGMTGSMMAMQAIALLIGAPFETLSGQLWMTDLRRMTTDTLRLAPRPDCLCRGDRAAITLPKGAPPVVRLATLAPGDVLVDVREALEWASGSLAGAVHAPLSELENGTPPPEGGRLVLFCAAGPRARRAADILKDHNVALLDGGTRTLLP